MSGQPQRDRHGKAKVFDVSVPSPGWLGWSGWCHSIIVKVLAIPILWLFNAMGYLVSFVAIRRGYSGDVLTYRGLAIALLVRITNGFILGRLV